jgi:hypothetical protein
MGILRSEGFWAFLRRVIQPDVGEFPHAERMRKLTSWLFNLARNILLVSAIRYLDLKSHSLILQIADGIAFWALFGYIISYWAIWEFNIFSQLSKSKRALAADAILSTTIFFAVAGYAYPAVNVIVETVANAQTTSSAPTQPKPGANSTASPPSPTRTPTK